VGFGILVQAVDDPPAFTSLVAAAEAAGADHFWVADSSLHGRAVWPYLTLAAGASERILLGPGITHPVTRHPAVTANAVAALDEISGGRAVLGIGAGDRPVLELGLRPAPVRVLEKAIGLIRALLAGETVTRDDGAFPVAGARLVRPPDRRVAVVVAASGPKTLRMAGRVADGVLVQVGVHPACVRLALDDIAAGAREAGRDPAEIDISLMVYGSIRDDPERARAESRHFAAWIPQTVPRYCPAAGIPDADVARVREAYGGGELMKADAAASTVTDQMIDAFTLAGTPAECRDRIAALTEIGIDHITFFPMGDDRRGGVARFAAAMEGMV